MIQAKELMYDETEGWDGSQDEGLDGSQDNSDAQIELDKERDNG